MKRYYGMSFMAACLLALLALGGAAGTGAVKPPVAAQNSLRVLYVPQPPQDAVTPCEVSQEIAHLEYWPQSGEGVYTAQFSAWGGGSVTLSIEGAQSSTEISSTDYLLPYTLTVALEGAPEGKPAVISLQSTGASCKSPQGQLGQRVTSLNLHVGEPISSR